MGHSLSSFRGLARCLRPLVNSVVLHANKMVYQLFQAFTFLGISTTVWALYRACQLFICAASPTWAVYSILDRSRPSSFLGSCVFVTRRSGGHSNDHVPNAYGHSMARALNLCLFAFRTFQMITFLGII